MKGICLRLCPFTSFCCFFCPPDSAQQGAFWLGGSLCFDVAFPISYTSCQPGIRSAHLTFTANLGGVENKDSSSFVTGIGSGIFQSLTRWFTVLWIILKAGRHLEGEPKNRVHRSWRVHHARTGGQRLVSVMSKPGTGVSAHYLLHPPLSSAKKRSEKKWTHDTRVVVEVPWCCLEVRFSTQAHQPLLSEEPRLRLGWGTCLNLQQL